jgi:ABC-2 type transport system permease protein
MKLILSYKNLSILAIAMEARQRMSIVLRIFLYILVMLLFSQTLRAAKTSVESLFYIAMTQLLVSSFAPQSFEIFNDIHLGLYSLRIGKPLNYIAIHFLRSMSAYIYRLAILIITFLLLQRVMPNLLGKIVPAIGSFICFAIIGGSIYSLLSILIGLASYWAKDVKVLFYLNMTTLFSLGGLIVPLELYSKTAQKIAFYSPYPYILWYPARAAHLGNFVEPRHLLVQGIWFAVLTLFTVVVYHRLSKSLLVHD